VLEKVAGVGDVVAEAMIPATGAGLGALVGGPLGAVVGAGIGVAVDGAAAWLGWQETTQQAAEARVIERIELPPTWGSLWAEFGATLVGITVIAFLLGWILLGPGEMTRRWKAGRRKLGDLIGFDRRDTDTNQEKE
jgi:hypothetical protein